MLTAGKGGRKDGRLRSEHASPAKKGRHAGVEQALEGERGESSGSGEALEEGAGAGAAGRKGRKGLLADEG